MSVRSGQSITTVFTTRNFSTGAAVNADSLPTGTLYVNGTADAATVTVTNITTGVYKAAVTLPTLALSDVVNLRINATVNSITDNGIIWTDTKDFFAGSVPDVVAGGAGGLFIAGSNAATTTAGLTTGALACSTLTASGAVAFQSTWGVTGAATFTGGLTSNITGTLSHVTLVDTTSINSDMRGTDNAALASAWTSARAGYLDNLNVGGAVASHADILALNQSASKHILIQTVGQYERPESGSTTYTVELRTFDATTGAAVNADSTPTIVPYGSISGDLSANLGALSNPATGVYRAIYTTASNATQEQIRMDGAATIALVAFTLSCYTQVVDEVSATWTSTDASHLTGIFNKLPVNNIADETLVLSAVGSPMQAYTQPAGFLAATFPSGTIANTTNITAGEITTVTNQLTAATIAAAVRDVSNSSPPAGSLGESCRNADAKAADIQITLGSPVTTVSGDIAAIPAGVVDLATSGHTTSGTFGAAIVAAGSAGDPLAASVPGAYGAGTAGFAIGTYLDAAITSRMATYTQPTGFLATTFPAGTVASTTNITAGTMTTTTNLTNLPAAPTDWLTAAAVKADAVTKIQVGLSTYAGGDTSGTTTLLSRVPAAAALASQIPVDFTAGTFASAGVFSAGALVNSPGGVLDLSQTGFTPRALDDVEDDDITLGDCLVAALCASTGKQAVSGLAYVIQTPFTATTIRSFVLDKASNPTSRS